MSNAVRLDAVGGPNTTAGVIAIGNLDARIEGLAGQAARGSLTTDGWVEWVELTALRGHVLGRIDEAERAASLAEAFVDQAPREPPSLMTRARTAALFHRFPAALADLDAAAALGLDHRSLEEERAAVYQAVGRYDEALALHRQALSRRADLNTLGALARCHAERGETVEAEKCFLAARRDYRRTSPFPLAMLEFQCGHMWLAHGDLVGARAWLESAGRRLPSYVPVQGHLAHVDAAEGTATLAIDRLRRVAHASDDPDYANWLAHALEQSGATAEARFWNARAALRYDELIARHPEAYADHAAEFWLSVGDPDRALRLALQNLALRPTPRARALVDRARGRVGELR
ncbi:tetratricopeptide repeat protein [Streptomyces sp. NRRL S-1448]|uniref:tetratricopeptide repeat protein n=1 Tax=Streptomyces sp. NRRL S-1448 TaxID=1463883 RepID=UPI001F2DB6F6|nr:tetratricopeptide repeat protein [Streptomyces sp. NRRL S-1448]